MNCRLLAITNAAIAALLFGFGVYTLVVAGGSVDADFGAVILLSSCWLAANSFAVFRRSLPMVLILAIPVVMVAALFVLMLLFAPLAWGDSNMPMVYLLQGTALFVAAIQIASIAAVVAARTKKPENGEA